jgi:8-oxo-dGTP diphosphatase
MRPRKPAAQVLTKFRTTIVNAKPFRLAVKAVIFDDRRRCLLLRRAAHNHNFVGCWEWPGGKVEPGEEFAAALLREVREEMGLEIELTGLAGATAFEMPAVKVVLLCMEARVVAGEPRLSEEHDDFAWASLPELAKYRLAEQIRDFVLDYAKRKGEQP